MPDPTTPPLVTAAFAAEGAHTLEGWQAAIEASEKKREPYLKIWDEQIYAYLTKYLTITPTRDTVVVPMDFTLVENKRAQIAFRVPQVTLKPREPLMRGRESAIAAFEARLNAEFDPDRADAASMLEETAFDALCPAGLMACKIGYRAYEDGTRTVQVGEQPAAIQPPAPMPPPGAVLGLGVPPPPAPIMEPVYEEVPNVVHEEFVLGRISPAKLLIPHDFHGSNYDKAPWLGFEFVENASSVAGQYGLNVEDLKPGVSDDHRLGPEKNAAAATDSEDGRVRGWEIWYRASAFDSAVTHPLRLRQLVLIDGLETPAVHRDSPYQQFDADGRFVGGMVGHPIHVRAMRYVSDCSYPPSECQISRPLVDELSKFRSQMVLTRDRAIPMIGFDANRVDKETQDKIQRGEFMSAIPFNTPITDDLFRELAKPHPLRENYTGNDYVTRDIGQVWSMGPNQRSDDTEVSRTATEVAEMRAWAATRLEKDRNKVLEFFVGVARKLGDLILLLDDRQDYVEILGEQGATEIERGLKLPMPQMVPWDRQQLTTGEGPAARPIRFAYEIRPDTGVRLDAASEQKRALDLYNLTGKDPLVNRTELLQILFRKFQLDPSKLMAKPQPPKPEPANISYAFKGADLNNPLVLMILQQSGVQIPQPVLRAAMDRYVAESAVIAQTMNATPPAVPSIAARPSTDHPGAMEGMEPVSKHPLERTGQRSGPRMGQGA